MEWRDSFLDLVLIPLSLLLPMAYHAWLWREIRLRPLRTAAGINAAARRLWAAGMMKDNAKNAVTVVQSVRNVIMGSTLMATTAILFCTGIAAVLSSTYTVKKPLSGELAYSPMVGRSSGTLPIRVQILVLAPFLGFLPGFNRRYSFSGRRRARRQRGANGDFVNLEDLPAQSFGAAHRGRVAYVCS
ncbi:unnamed protein product [Urochloa humidicola]